MNFLKWFYIIWTIILVGLELYTRFTNILMTETQLFLSFWGLHLALVIAAFGIYYFREDF